MKNSKKIESNLVHPNSHSSYPEDEILEIFNELEIIDNSLKRKPIDFNLNKSSKTSWILPQEKVMFDELTYNIDLNIRQEVSRILEKWKMYTSSEKKLFHKLLLKIFIFHRKYVKDKISNNYEELEEGIYAMF